MFSPPASSGKNGPTSLGSGHFSGSSTSVVSLLHTHLFSFFFCFFNPPCAPTPAHCCFVCCLTPLLWVKMFCTCRCSVLVGLLFWFDLKNGTVALKQNVVYVLVGLVKLLSVFLNPNRTKNWKIHTACKSWGLRRLRNQQSSSPTDRICVDYFTLGNTGFRVSHIDCDSLVFWTKSLILSF